MLFISHNLAVVRHLSHRILVMYSGRLVEIAPRDALFAAPIHPYTRALLAAVPSLPRTRDGAIEPLQAPPMPSPPIRSIEPAAPLPTSESGCAFRDRCAYAVAVCETTVPPLEEVAPGHWVACHEAVRFVATRRP
jgi:oligopeptide/dipeptide ABC transporter ATP-binding protein